MMNFLKRLRKNKRKIIASTVKIIILLPIIFILVAEILFWMASHGFFDEYFVRYEQKQEEEIDRINDYFQGEYEVYKIPSWIERSLLFKKLGTNLYVLQTEEDAQRNIISGLPYWPYASRREALRHYKILSKEEREGYLVISQSIVYIEHIRSDEEKEIMEEAARYFENEANAGG